MEKLEEMYFSELNETIHFAYERKQYYATKKYKVLFSIIETQLKLPFKLEIWGTLR